MAHGDVMLPLVCISNEGKQHNQLLNLHRGKIVHFIIHYSLVTKHTLASSVMLDGLSKPNPVGPFMTSHIFPGFPPGVLLQGAGFPYSTN